VQTIEEWKKAQADRYFKEQQALVNVLQQRMKWHHEQWEHNEEATIKRVHEELFKQDQDTLDEVRKKYDQQRGMFKTRHKLNIPELKVEE
jgi:predicted transcriptional regulator